MKRMMIPLALTLLTLTLLTGCVVVPMAPGGSVYSPPLPPPLAFQAPPVVIVIPDTDNVYVVPDISADLFFWNGFWWRLNNGFWYRSQYTSVEL
ncbi:MAG: hypothetical protein NT010_09630 [Proteobacteria bacterium]|nr:hypothetical protein [Pseudomonadota bacterium]